MLSSGKTLKITSQLYSGRDNGWTREDFHSRCDYKQRTVSLFLIADGDCIGGYTSQHWDGSDKLKADNTAFLFNLTHSRHFPSKGTGIDIFCGRLYGPCFDGGGSDSELAAYSPFKYNNKCKSTANKPGYEIPLVGGINQLTN
jgi:hypothetical protein